MSNFTFDEINLMCIYNTGTRAGLMQALTDMRGQLEPDEAELLELTDSALRKLGRITDEQFYAWSEKAREEKKKCDREIISLEEFQQWLRDSKI